MFKRSRVTVVLLLVGLVAGVVFAGLCLDHQQIFTYSDSQPGFDHAVHYTSAQGHDIPSIPLTPPQAEPFYSLSSSSGSSGDKFVQNYSTGAHEYYDPRCDIPNRSIRGPEWVTVSPGALERITPNKPILVPEAFSEKQRQKLNRSDFAEQMRAASDETRHRMNIQAAKNREYLLRGMTTTPDQWRQILKELGLPEVSLLTEYNYWQIAKFRQYLETIPGFREHIRQLAQAIKDNPKFMKDGVWGLEYEKHNTKYFREKLGNNPLGMLFGGVAGLFSDPRDHSKFHDLVHAYEDYFSQQEAVEAVQLQAVKDHNQALADQLEEIYNPSDPSDPREPFPTIIRTNTYDDPFCISDVAKYYEGQSALIPHTKGMEPYRDRILQRAKALRAASMDTSTPTTHTLKLDPAVLQESPELGYVAHFDGNAAQLRLHKELVYEINSARNLLKETPNNPFAQANEPLIQAISSAAVVQENPQAAFHFADACFHLNSLTQILDRAIPNEAKIVAGGVAMGLEQTAQHVASLLTHPIDTVYNDLVNTGKLAATALSAGYTLAFGSQEDAQLIINKLVQTKNYFRGNPEQAVAFITQMLIPVPGAMALASGKNLGIISKLATGIKKQQQFAAAVGAVAGVSNKSATALAKALQPAIQSVQKVVKKTTQTPVVKATVAATKTLREEVIALYGTTMPPINWKHIFHTEMGIKKGAPSLKGYHSENKISGIKILSQTPPNAHGVYKAIFTDRGLTKTSTFFPKDWNRSKILEKSREAWNDAMKNIKSQTNARGVIGKTSEGMPIEFWFHRDCNGKYIINSIYPPA
jgi:hypothetical protein